MYLLPFIGEKMPCSHQKISELFTKKIIRFCYRTGCFFRLYSTIKFFANRTIIYLDKTCPKGTILLECGALLQRDPPKRGEDGKVLRDDKGRIIRESYRIKVFNTINFKKSLHYNPFVYLHSEKDILKFVTALISNTKGDGKTGDEFANIGQIPNFEKLIATIRNVE